MSKVRLLGVWTAALLIAIISAAAWVGLQHMDDGSPPKTSVLLLEAMQVLGLTALCQVGLVLAPIARRWRPPYRMIVALLMVPTLFVTLTVGYQQLADAAFWGTWAFRRVDSIWMPVLLLYVTQLGGLVRSPPRTNPDHA